jgi:hypothetical protein
MDLTLNLLIPKRLAESPRITSRVKLTPTSTSAHGTRIKISPPVTTGETSMVRTTSPGTRTSTSPFTADHAGLKELLPLSPIDSTSSSLRI